MPNIMSNKRKRSPTNAPTPQLTKVETLPKSRPPPFRVPSIWQNAAQNLVCANAFGAHVSRDVAENQDEKIGNLARKIRMDRFCGKRSRNVADVPISRKDAENREEKNRELRAQN